MGRLFLVRHGQASFGADNYDQLSPLGTRQCVRLGDYFRTKGLSFDGVLTGTLQRQIQSYEGIAEGLQARQDPLRWPGLNEYDSHAVIATVHPQTLEKPTSPEMVRHHFRLLRDGLQQWMAGKSQPLGMPRYADFVAGVRGALDHVRTHHDGDVLIVSSGGPIATAVGLLMGATPEASIELNLRIRNSSVTEFTFTPKRHSLVTYNTLPHLDSAEYADWITHA
ncbi:histidine phosphatase family protein [Aquabacterium sp.]|uniref:histidine phosphatase family protein n=1 Tax=Aquabacterium sp. TaxID=1872578 RepID=UPI002CE52A76|nr:histidine phosphatase family protein [Aquabacterium sp.]HSW03260.1 histidine phosphatase family protein [Aquabacterium sp.]